MAAQKFLINLLPAASFGKSFSGKTLNWFLTVGRHLIVAVEVIAIAAFLARFILDKNLADLNTAIKEKESEIQSFGNLENDFRSLQERLKIIRHSKDNQLPAGKVLAVFSEITPTDISFNNLSLKNKDLTFEAVSGSEASLAVFLNEMQKNKQFEEINLVSLVSAGSGKSEIKFTVKAKINQ